MAIQGLNGLSHREEGALALCSGNGSLMRLAPVPIFHAARPATGERASERASVSLVQRACTFLRASEHARAKSLLFDGIHAYHSVYARACVRYCLQGGWQQLYYVLHMFLYYTDACCILQYISCSRCHSYPRDGPCTCTAFLTQRWWCQLWRWRASPA